MSSLPQKYQLLWKAIIRPPRANYTLTDLGPTLFKTRQGLKIQRTDIQLTNKRGHKLKCSHYQPYIRPCRQLPCVIYLHGNSSCRLEGRACIPYILSRDTTLFTFDFSGCGISEGQYISLGYYERDDVEVVFQYLRSLNSVSSIGLWGRSMGAVTSLMYVDKNPEIACIVLDSPFSNLEKLCSQLAQKFAGGFISFFSGIALKFVSSTIQQKNHFKISSLDPIGKHVKNAYIPAFFLAARDDDFVDKKHTEILFKNYSGEKRIEIVQGDHNSQRKTQVNYMISNFFYQNLHVDQLVKEDKQFIQIQKQQRKKTQEKLRQKQAGKQGYSKTFEQIKSNRYSHVNGNKVQNNNKKQQNILEVDDQQRQLQRAIRQSQMIFQIQQQKKKKQDGSLTKISLKKEIQIIVKSSEQIKNKDFSKQENLNQRQKQRLQYPALSAVKKTQSIYIIKNKQQLKGQKMQKEELLNMNQQNDCLEMDQRFP